MSEQSLFFTEEDVRDAWFASEIDRDAGEDRTPLQVIQARWPLTDSLFEGEGRPLLWPHLLEQYTRGALLLVRAKVVSCRVVGEITEAHYQRLGPIHSPIWVDDQGHVPPRKPKVGEGPRAWLQPRSPRLRYLRALCLRKEGSFEGR